jgi:transcriptional regulator with XRE-family HTH domain
LKTPRLDIEGSVGERVATARREAGLTQRELAHGAGLSLWQLQRVEAGESAPPDELLRLAEGPRAPESAEVMEALEAPEDTGPPTAPEPPNPPSAAQPVGGRGRGLVARMRELAHTIGRRRELPSAPRERPRSSPSALEAVPREAFEEPLEDPVSERPFERHPFDNRRVIAGRHEAGLTRRELADRLGASLWEIERIEAGEEVPSRVQRLLPAALEKPPEWLEPSRGVNAPAVDLADTGEERTDANWLVLATIALLVVTRFFTEVVGVLPRALNFIDVPLFFCLMGAVVFRQGRKRDVGRDAERYAVPALLLLVLCIGSAIANPSRVEPAPAVVFAYGLLAPIGVYWATYHLWTTGRTLSVSRLIISLGVVELAVVGLIDLPRFLTAQNPDLISGTFGTNGYQLVFFLLVFGAVLAGIFTFEHQRLAARVAPVLFVGALASIFLAQFRALLLTTVLTVVLLAALLGSARFRGVVAGVVIAGALLVTLSYTAQAFPVLKFAPTIQAFRKDPGSFVSQRLRAVENVSELFSGQPRYVLTGAGPGTFSSRGWQTFALADSTSGSNVQGAYARRLTGGRVYETDVSDRFVIPQAREGKVVGGSRALSSPYLSYSSVLAELGVLGLVLLAGIYLAALARSVRMTLVARRRAGPGDPLPAVLLGSTVALFVLVQMGILDNWLEVTRLTFPTWALLAIATKEYQARHGAAR